MICLGKKNTEQSFDRFGKLRTQDYPEVQSAPLGKTARDTDLTLIWCVCAVLTT
jgi:hypothetical protein